MSWTGRRSKPGRSSRRHADHWPRIYQDAMKVPRMSGSRVGPLSLPAEICRYDVHHPFRSRENASPTRRIERSAWAEQPPWIGAGHSAVAARDHVEAIDEEVRVNGGTHWLPGARADEQRAHPTVILPMERSGPELARGSTRHPPDVTSWVDSNGHAAPVRKTPYADNGRPGNSLTWVETRSVPLLPMSPRCVAVGPNTQRARLPLSDRPSMRTAGTKSAVADSPACQISG